MKIIQKHRNSPFARFTSLVGKRLNCEKCGCIFEVEEGDLKNIKSKKGTRYECAAGIEGLVDCLVHCLPCPNTECENSVEIDY